MDDTENIRPDVDADDAKASGMLGMIGRDEAEESGSDEKAAPPMRTSHGASPFLLESLYFRSFGERGLLTREEETAIAKRVDQGTQAHSDCSASSRKNLFAIQTHIRLCRQHKNAPTDQTIERAFGYGVGQCGNNLAHGPESVPPGL